MERWYRKDMHAWYDISYLPIIANADYSHLCKLYNDFLSNSEDIIFDNVRDLEATWRTKDETLTDKTVEKAFVSIAKPRYDAKVAPSMAVAKRCGNLYTGSLYTGLASLLSNVPPMHIVGKRILMFGFGGGCAASMYALRIAESPAYMVEKMNLTQRLASMDVTSVGDYLTAMDVCRFNLPSYPLVY
jgi:hydroxymethylglutaryl-CoA synthase